MPELAYTFMFEAPISPRLRRAGARRMLAYPETLQDTVLRVAAEDIAHPTGIHHAAYVALAPGRSRDDLDPSRVRRRSAPSPSSGSRSGGPALAPSSSPTTARLGEGWPRAATRISEQRDTTNPFGFADWMYSELLRTRSKVYEALALYQSGRHESGWNVAAAP